MKFEDKLQDVQKSLVMEKLDGWLLYDFRFSNDLACEFLEIPKDKIFTRRFFYWIPSKGSPVKIVHQVESKNLDHLPGVKWFFLSWKELEGCIANVLKGAKSVAMEYSPRNAIPDVSKVDGGTIDIVRGCGVGVVSSADLLQKYSCVWDEYKLQMHLEAADVLDEAVKKAWDLIAKRVLSGNLITDYEVQQYLLKKFEENACITEDSPICAVNADSADPHFSPKASHPVEIQKGDFVLIDLWCKRNSPRATYADITRVGVVDKVSTKQQEKIFSVVKEARDAALELVERKFKRGVPLMGFEVDVACRQVIEKAGYEKYFIHRTGHNIDINDHGSGCHLDNLETQDRRMILPGTCFSIEPGIYLPGEFGIRLEYDVYIGLDSSVRVTGGIQNEIVCMLA